jgi:hypothetical protein
MARLVAIEVLLFLAPFAAYALWLLLARRIGRTVAPVAGGRLVGLALAGLLLMLAAFALLATYDDQKLGTYRPAEFRDGVLVPGRIE